MPWFRSAAAAFAVLLASLPHAPLTAQIQAHARLDGEYLPVATYDKTSIEVLKNGKLKRASDMDYVVRPHPTFGAGFVEIRDVQADLDPLRQATLKQRTDPGAVRFRYRAMISADRPLAHCYALLSFVAQGSLGTVLIELDNLSPGKAQEVKFESVSQVDVVGSLHVFAESLEIRTTQQPAPYDVIAYYERLVATGPGLSAAELQKLADIFPHELSADGRYLATLRQRDAKKVLLVYDLQDMKPVGERPVTQSDDVVRDLTWVSDHEIAYIAEENINDWRSEYVLHLFDFRSGQDRRLDEDVFNIIKSIPAKPEVLVVVGGRNGTGFYKYNVRTKKSFDFEDPDSGEYRFDREGNARVRVSYKGDRVIYSCRPTPDGPWRELDDLVKEPGLKFNRRAAELLERVADVEAIGPDGDTLYLSSRLKSDRFELCAFSMSEGVIKHPLAKHPRYDLSSDSGLTRLFFAKNTTKLLGMAFEGQRAQIVWFDKGFAATQAAMDAQFPKHTNWPVDWSADGKTFIYFSSSDQDPGTYSVFLPAESRLIPLLPLSERLQGKTLAPMVPFEFAARDGVKIPAYLTRPVGSENRAVPLIVLIHGGPMARDQWGFSAMNQFFASRGYAVLQVNYRGSSGYGAAFQTAGLRARLDTVVIDDIADGVKHLIAQGAVDPSRVVAMGGSFGGWATYISLAKYPELYRAGIAIAAVSNWRKTLSDDRWRFENRTAYSFWKTLLNRGSFAEDEKYIDPFLRAAEIKQPVFIIHGERDNVVHATEAKLMLEKLRKTNTTVRAKSFPNSSHSYWPFADRVIQLNEIAGFLTEHLGSGETSAPPTPLATASTNP